VFLVVAYASTYFGFSPSVSERFAGKADFPAPWMLQLHVFVATGWMLGLALQVALIRTSRPQLHRRMGLGMMALATLVVVTAIGAGWLMRRNAAAHKRLMLLGTTAVLIAAYTRWWGEGLYSVVGYDLLTRRWLGL
jgi:uncharacterized membrane protein YozB (DUF420 family)